MRPGKRAALDLKNKRDALTEKIEKAQAAIKAKVEQPLRVMKRQFGFIEVGYRGSWKNTAQLVTLFALSNLWMASGKLMGNGASDRKKRALRQQKSREAVQMHQASVPFIGRPTK